jgi:hypothetical protein
VNWRHKIAVVALVLLAALPLAGTICAMTCVSASTAVTAHQDCEKAAPAPAASDVRVGALSDFDCGHHEGTLPQVAATAPQRADLAVMAAQAASDPVHPLFGSPTAFDSLFQYTPPPDSAPPTTTPLVLRV